MVFVSIGTQRQQFSRLFEIIKKSNLLKNEHIIAQLGYTKCDNTKIESFKFIEEDKLKEYIQKADFVISHGGVGTIFTCLNLKKKVLVIPRLKKFKEHKNDHQLEICRELEKQGYIVYLKENEDIDEKIKLLKNTEFKEYIQDKSYLSVLEKEI